MSLNLNPRNLLLGWEVWTLAVAPEEHGYHHETSLLPWLCTSLYSFDPRLLDLPGHTSLVTEAHRPSQEFR